MPAVSGAAIPPWRPDRLAQRLPALKQRAAALAALRQWFAEAGFTEVQTPCLQIAPAMEPHLQGFEVRGRGTGAGHWLQTSPEFAMKKLLAGGLPAIYQVAHCFRDEPYSRTHHPEFTMLEWYRTGCDYRDLMDQVEGLVQAAARGAQVEHVRRGEIVCDVFGQWQRLTVAEAFARYCGIDPFATIDDTENPSREALEEMARPLGIEAGPDDGWEDVFFRLFLNRVEPHLGVGVPTLLSDYPASMAALSKVPPNRPQIAERVELYICGVELANGFTELTDGAEQRRRFTRDLALRRRVYGQSYPLDEDFLAAIDHGLPDCAGMALGFDRLIMLLTGAEGIDDVLWLPVAG